MAQSCGRRQQALQIHECLLSVIIPLRHEQRALLKAHLATLGSGQLLMQLDFIPGLANSA